MKLRQNGFTLLELMITVIIGGIIMAIGLPAFSSFVKNNRLVAQTNSVLSALHLARSEAVNRDHDIRVLPIIAGTDWTLGWQVVDLDDGIVLRSYDLIENGTLMETLGNASITYKSSGYATAESELTLIPNECVADDKRIISVKRPGLASFERKKGC